MDGTIIDTEPIWQRSQVDLTNRYGAEWTHEDGLSLVGSGLERSGELLRAKGVDMEVEEIIQWMTDYVMEHLRAGELPWRPGARELVEELHARGIPTALVTMSRRKMALVAAEALGERGFRVVVAGDDVDRPKRSSASSPPRASRSRTPPPASRRPSPPAPSRWPSSTSSRSPRSPAATCT
jgi:beta-phosphoglucomutase-like phosphatase (HAD superfamily)